MSNYKRYPKEEIVQNWTELLNLSIEEVTELQKEWEQIEVYNETVSGEMRKKHQEKTEEIAEELTALNVEVYNKNKSYKAWFVNNIEHKIWKNYYPFPPALPKVTKEKQYVKGIELVNPKHEMSLLEFYHVLTFEYKKKKEKVSEYEQLLQLSKDYINTKEGYGWLLDDNEIIKKADKLAKEKYIEENYENGTQVHIKGVCQKCDSWTIGENRCSCGNRRIYLEVEGNLLEGIYAYPVAD